MADDQAADKQIEIFLKFNNFKNKKGVENSTPFLFGRWFSLKVKTMRGVGIEPTRVTPCAPQTHASASSATRA